MAIDRIGKGGPAAEVPKAEAGRPAGGVERAFEARAEKAEAASPTSAALQQLRAGKIDVEGYLQMKLDEATAHLQGLLPADLATIRKALRERLASDPALVDLAKQASGQAPPPAPDDE
jgi:uncharacterized protein (DUF2342 family)